VVLLAMILMGIGRIYFANKAGMRDYDFLIDFLKSTCEAEKIDFQGQHKVRQANQEA
jgi:hypothetical protein